MEKIKSFAKDKILVIIFALTIIMIFTTRSGKVYIPPTPDVLESNLHEEFKDMVVDTFDLSEYRANKVKYWFVHCSATDPKYPWSVDRLKTFFIKEKKWSRYGYNYYITYDGVMHEMTPINWDSFVDFNELTNNAAGYNSVSFAVCLEGGSKYTNGRMIDNDNFSKEQIETLKHFIAKVKKSYPNIKIQPHNSVTKKSCPVLDLNKVLTAIDAEPCKYK